MQGRTHEELLRGHQPEAGPSWQPSCVGGPRFRERRFRLAAPVMAVVHRGPPDRPSGSDSVVCEVGERCRSAVLQWGVRGSLV